MTSVDQGIKTVFGGAASALLTTTETSPQDVPALFDLLDKHNIKIIDSALVYGDSEKNLGTYGAVDRGFTLDTKLPGGMQPETMTEEGVVKTGRASLERLKTKKVDILYIHCPAESVPIASTLAGIDKLHKEGAFERFGLSNYLPEDVEKVYIHCKEKGYVLPTVFQGSYNAFGRKYEEEGHLLPLLRKLGISFYAYSPAAGGFLSKSQEELFSGGGRFDLNSGSKFAGLYNSLYSDKPSMMKAHGKWLSIAEEAGLKPGAMALRWVKYNSFLKREHGDAIIVGGRTPEQIDESLSLLEQGPLSDDVTQKIDLLWEDVKKDAITDNFNDFIARNL